MQMKEKRSQVDGVGRRPPLQQQTGQDKSTAPTAQEQVSRAEISMSTQDLPACALAVATPDDSKLGCPQATNATGTQDQGNTASEAGNYSTDITNPATSGRVVEQASRLEG